MVTPAELDRAWQAGKMELTRRNVRKVRCACCRVLQQVGAARRLWLDGHKRGFLCIARCGPPGALFHAKAK